MINYNLKNWVVRNPSGSSSVLAKDGTWTLDFKDAKLMRYKEAQKVSKLYPYTNSGIGKICMINLSAIR